MYMVIVCMLVFWCNHIFRHNIITIAVICTYTGPSQANDYRQIHKVGLTIRTYNLSMMALVKSEQVEVPPKSPVLYLPSAMVAITALWICTTGPVLLFVPNLHLSLVSYLDRPH
jgi:hypothetical protein